MTGESARDLLGLLVVLALIVAGMIFFTNRMRDPQADAQKDWYYERIAPPSSGSPRQAPSVNR